MVTGGKLYCYLYAAFDPSAKPFLNRSFFLLGLKIKYGRHDLTITDEEAPKKRCKFAAFTFVGCNQKPFDVRHKVPCLCFFTFQALLLWPHSRNASERPTQHWRHHHRGSDRHNYDQCVEVPGQNAD